MCDWPGNEDRRSLPMKPLPRSFYLRPTLTVARDLLGKLLVRKIRGRVLSGTIVEVEAYLGEKDPASHAYRGKTKRNEVMFMEGGHLYVYFTYGMHFCCNVVTEREGIARAVLLRALQPIEGIQTMAVNRGVAARGKELSKSQTKILAGGPARLCQALAIARDQNGTDLLSNEIFISEGETVPASRIVSTSRIGITDGREKKWRFFLKRNPFVSR